MDEDVTDQTAGAPQSGPAAAARGGTVIEAFPGELGAGGAIARAVAHVEIGIDDEVNKLGRFDAEIHMRTSVSALAELMVRIHSPPARSLRTIGSVRTASM